MGAGATISLDVDGDHAGGALPRSWFQVEIWDEVAVDQQSTSGIYQFTNWSRGANPLLMVARGKQPSVRPATAVQPHSTP